MRVFIAHFKRKTSVEGYTVLLSSEFRHRRQGGGSQNVLLQSLL